MKTILFIICIFVCLGFSPDKKFEKKLCDKLWITPSSDNEDYKILITFHSNNLYEHSYAVFNDSKKEISGKIIFTGTWSIGEDDKIYVTYNNPDTKTKSEISKDVYKILSITNSELKIQTLHAGIQKLKTGI